MQVGCCTLAVALQRPVTVMMLPAADESETRLVQLLKGSDTYTQKLCALKATVSVLKGLMARHRVWHELWMLCRRAQVPADGQDSTTPF